MLYPQRSANQIRLIFDWDNLKINRRDLRDVCGTLFRAVEGDVKFTILVLESKDLVLRWIKRFFQRYDSLFRQDWIVRGKQGEVVGDPVVLSCRKPVHVARKSLSVWISLLLLGGGNAKIYQGMGNGCGNKFLSFKNLWSFIFCS